MKNARHIKEELSRFAHKISKDNLTVASGGNISLRNKDQIYIKRQGVFFNKARPSDFTVLDIENPSVKIYERRPSLEYKFHIICYKKRPDVNAVVHTHPLFITTLSSVGLELRPVTLEFAVYIAKNITSIGFILPGTKGLAVAVGNAVRGHDAIVMKNHGLITVGSSLQEAYLKTIVIEAEAKAQFICRLFKRPPPFLKEDDIARLASA
jgi:L-fuculose-phosphate aldolase